MCCRFWTLCFVTYKKYQKPLKKWEADILGNEYQYFVTLQSCPKQSRPCQNRSPPPNKVIQEDFTKWGRPLSTIGDFLANALSWFLCNIFNQILLLHTTCLVILSVGILCESRPATFPVLDLIKDRQWSTKYFVGNCHHSTAITLHELQIMYQNTSVKGCGAEAVDSKWGLWFCELTVVLSVRFNTTFLQE